MYCRDHALPLRERIGLLLQVAAAVAHAHSRLVVHRDLKPGNILVTADGQVRLLDFGIAKLMEVDRTEATSLTHLSGRALTLDYASPEQIRSEPLGTASDVYSLAVVAYELLAGERPYRLKRSSAAELEEAITSIDPPLASAAAREPALRKQLKGDLDAILNKALKKDTSQRYATVEALADDLRRHLDQRPVLAQPDRLGSAPASSSAATGSRWRPASSPRWRYWRVPAWRSGRRNTRAHRRRAPKRSSAWCCPSSKTLIRPAAAAARQPPSIYWNRRACGSPKCR